MAAPDRYGLCNRDVIACLNYMHILRGLRRNGMAPHKFHQVAVAPTRRRRRDASRYLRVVEDEMSNITIAKYGDNEDLLNIDNIVTPEHIQEAVKHYKEI
ncbi:hypothetical protein G6F70_004695 [Rhizopus microsporus]|nr:hypothetical protein G6F71_004831 [Rhizopus microsporus]KAG1199706.1 hypothetical protein G6F70_004695 [Rhizopus microsporus]KAG1211501.1 hypothetical protein G6F69_004550 [Rhizopus microsporus]KAG1233356.1 hypothetical protein G6F67_004342 [Rhizopus microsporus]KAG1265385.1 hypothetical protein G6F68_003628 [Rhizopus microsporus]